MSYVTTQPEALAAAAGTLQGIGAAMSFAERGGGGADHGCGARGGR